MFDVFRRHYWNVCYTCPRSGLPQVSRNVLRKLQKAWAKAEAMCSHCYTWMDRYRLDVSRLLNLMSTAGCDAEGGGAHRSPHICRGRPIADQQGMAPSPPERGRSLCAVPVAGRDRGGGLPDGRWPANRYAWEMLNTDSQKSAGEDVQALDARM